MNKKIFIVLLLATCYLLLFTFLFAQETKKLETYIIGVGDELDIYVYPGEEFSKLVTVGDDGKITMPIIGRVDVSGLSVKMLIEKLTKEISRYVANPRVTITIRKFGRPSEIYLTGQVVRPGTYSYREGLKLLELISLAGGAGEQADIGNIKITRGAERKMLLVDLRKDVALEPGDIIEVPKLEPIPPLQILGQVRYPGTYSYRKDIKLLEVITLAGGFTDNADLKNIRLHRAGSKPQTIKINVDAILLKGKIEKDVTLQGGDIIYIPRTGIAWWGWFINSIVPTFTLVGTLVLLFRGI